MANEKSGPGSDVFDEIQRDWVPLASARFLFFPEYAAQELSFFANVKRILDASLLAGEFIEVVQHAERIVCVCAGDLRWIIDGQVGTFSLDKTDKNLEWSDEGIFEHFGPALFDRPELFFDQVRRSGPPLHDKASTELLVKLASILWDQLCKQFRIAIRSGSAEVYGRKGPVWSPLTRIYADQFDALQIQFPEMNDDLHFDDTIAIDPQGERVLSLYVRPVIRRASIKESQIQDARSWLISQMQITQDCRRPKAEFQTQIVAVWPDLGVRTFNRIWEQAKSAIKGNTYGAAGRPKSKHCIPRKS